MREIFYRAAKDDPNLRLELYAKRDNVVVEHIATEVSEASVFVRDGRCVVGELFTKQGAAEVLDRFADNNEKSNCTIEAKLYFNNAQTFFHIYYPNYVRALSSIRKDGNILLRMEVRQSYVLLIVDGYRKDSIEELPVAKSRTPLPKEVTEQIVEQCLAWQTENPPKKLSPMEQMRRRASGMFSAAPTKSNGQVAQSVSGTTGASQVFNVSTLKCTPGSKDYQKDLNRIIGLDNVKQEFEKMVIAHNFQIDRAKRLGLAVSQNSMHMCFLGAPGTGKTTIARIVAGYLYDHGIIKNNECIEINGLDLLANFTGQTSEKTRLIIERAKGGVLFIDEAYAIAEDRFGREAISVLLKEIEDNRGNLVVIFAGYENDMSRFLDMNEGFKSRINRYFHFENYTPTELSRIFMGILGSKCLVIEKEALYPVIEDFAKACKEETFSNGRYVRNLVEKIENQHIYNVRNCKDIERINVVTVADVQEVIK